MFSTQKNKRRRENAVIEVESSEEEVPVPVESEETGGGHENVREFMALHFPQEIYNPNPRPTDQLTPATRDEGHHSPLFGHHVPYMDPMHPLNPMDRGTWTPGGGWKLKEKPSLRTEKKQNETSWMFRQREGKPQKTYNQYNQVPKDTVERMAGIAKPEDPPPHGGEDAEDEDEDEDPAEIEDSMKQLLKHEITQINLTINKAAGTTYTHGDDWTSHLDKRLDYAPNKCRDPRLRPAQRFAMELEYGTSPVAHMVYAKFGGGLPVTAAHTRLISENCSSTFRLRFNPNAADPASPIAPGLAVVGLLKHIPKWGPCPYPPSPEKEADDPYESDRWFFEDNFTVKEKTKFANEEWMVKGRYGKHGKFIKVRPFLEYVMYVVGVVTPRATRDHFRDMVSRNEEEEWMMSTIAEAVTRPAASEPQEQSTVAKCYDNLRLEGTTGRTIDWKERQARRRARDEFHGRFNETPELLGALGPVTGMSARAVYDQDFDAFFEPAPKVRSDTFGGFRLSDEKGYAPEAAEDNLYQWVRPPKQVDPVSLHNQSKWLMLNAWYDKYVRRMLDSEHHPRPLTREEFFDQVLQTQYTINREKLGALFTDHLDPYVGEPHPLLVDPVRVIAPKGRDELRTVRKVLENARQPSSIPSEPLLRGPRLPAPRQTEE